MPKVWRGQKVRSLNNDVTSYGLWRPATVSCAPRGHIVCSQKLIESSLGAADTAQSILDFFLITVKPIVNTLLFTTLVPTTVAGWIPLWLREDSSVTDTPALRWLGILLIAAGVVIYLHTAFWGFALRGRGTPAPIAPTKKLVVDGLHRYARNPMYVGFAVGWIGLWVVFGRYSPAAIAVAAAVGLAVHLFVIFYEEPTLRNKFRTDYEDYCRNVNRWWPRLRAWERS